MLAAAVPEELEVEQHNKHCNLDMHRERESIGIAVVQQELAAARSCSCRMSLFSCGNISQQTD